MCVTLLSPQILKVNLNMCAAVAAPAAASVVFYGSCELALNALTVRCPRHDA
jgi:hypothetical protein